MEKALLQKIGELSKTEPTCTPALSQTLTVEGSSPGAVNSVATTCEATVADGKATTTKSSTSGMRTGTVAQRKRPQTKKWMSLLIGPPTLRRVPR